MGKQDGLAERFERERAHLRAVAYRMLGSLSEAEDAVQEAWIRLSGVDAAAIDNLGGWLTTVVARVCLDTLRTRKSRREEALDPEGAERIPARIRIDPEQEAVLASSVGLALLVILDMLDPAERLAFVLHDMFAMPFEEIAAIVGRSPDATRQLASRARRRVQGAPARPDADLTRQREVVDAYLAAARGGNFDALMALLDPDIVMHADRRIVPTGGSTEIRGAAVIANRAIKGGARAAQAVLINGSQVGLVVAPRGRLLMVILFTVADGRIREMQAIAEPERVKALEITLLTD